MIYLGCRETHRTAPYKRAGTPPWNAQPDRAVNEDDYNNKAESGFERGPFQTFEAISLLFPKESEENVALWINLILFDL